jgi:hypothetical protein
MSPSGKPRETKAKKEIIINPIDFSESLTVVEASFVAN